MQMNESELNELDYIMLNTEKNLWVGKETGKFVKDPSEALVLKRMPALQRFVDTANAKNGADYDVPVRLIDLTQVGMGLDDETAEE